jgi:hypothetical protein
MKRNRIEIGQRVRILPDVTRTAWGVPCCWGGMEGVITRGPARVSGRRMYRVALPDSDCTFGGNDFTEGMLEPVAPCAAQANLFMEVAP